MNIFLKEGIGAAKLNAKEILKDPVLFLAFGFGSGLSKKAPGTMGTLSAVPICWILGQFGFLFYSLIVVISCVIGVVICGKAATKLGVHDFNGIVWDEIVGLMLTLWLVPIAPNTIVVGFILFRAFDILKPWPICWLDQNVHGGVGIMLDDILAGVFSAIAMILIFKPVWIS